MVMGHDRADRIKKLQLQIQELKERWPAHTPSAGLLQQLDDLEQEFNALLTKETDAPQNGGP
jgi:FtsZ-binding cell division protein ZapB